MKGSFQFPPPGTWNKFTSTHTFTYYTLEGEDEEEVLFGMEVEWEIDSDLCFYPLKCRLFDTEGKIVHPDENLQRLVNNAINDRGPGSIEEEAVEQFCDPERAA